MCPRRLNGNMPIKTVRTRVKHRSKFSLQKKNLVGHLPLIVRHSWSVIAGAPAGTHLTRGNGGRILAAMSLSPQQRFRKSRRRGIAVSALIAATLIALTWFWLAAVVPYREHFTLYFPSGVHGLSVGAPVMMNGRTIGQVNDIAVEVVDGDDAGTRKFFAAVTITIDTKKLIEYGRLRRGESFREALPRLTEIGLRGQLRMPSMLASGLCVNLLFEPGTPSLTVNPPRARHPEIPTNYKSTSDFVDQANAFIETKNLYAVAAKVRALSATVKEFHAATATFDCARADAAILNVLERANASLDPRKTHETLRALNEDVLACRREIECENALAPERAESLRSSLKNLSDGLREMRESAKTLRENLEPENVEARKRFLRELRKRCEPLIDFAKDAFL